MTLARVVLIAVLVVPAIAAAQNPHSSLVLTTKDRGRAAGFERNRLSRWQGDTLVVQTLGLRDGAWIDRGGSPLTDAATITERYRRPSFGLVQVEVTVDDPKAYLRPWTVTLNQRLAADTELLDYHCTDNEKDAGKLVGKGQ